MFVLGFAVTLGGLSSECESLLDRLGERNLLPFGLASLRVAYSATNRLSANGHSRSTHCASQWKPVSFAI
jgi:hypothetical protein